MDSLIDRLIARGVVAVACEVRPTTILVGVLAAAPQAVPGDGVRLFDSTTETHYPVRLPEALETVAFDIELERIDDAAEL
ncbi:MAG: hypothetical protein ACFB0C_19515 [Leptolyngbyaceae cyanobacterium]